MHTVATEAPAGASAEVFHQLGQITRQLHDTLCQLGVMPQLQQATAGLPDARSRLHYIAQKTGDAANRVLNSVDQAKMEQSHIADTTRELARRLAADPVRAVASGAVMNFVGDVEATSARIDGHLTDIMMAQDFHDLTGQVIGKVVALASTLEESLVKLLLQTAPHEQRVEPKVVELAGPVVDPNTRSDFVSGQGEVDDLLTSLGF